MGSGDFRERKFGKDTKWLRVWCPTCLTLVKPDGSVVFAYDGKYYREVRIASIVEVQVSAKLERIMSRRWY